MGTHKIKYKLDDGTTITVEQLMTQTGWKRGTCYARLTRNTNRADVFKELAFTRSGRAYKLDDGTTWTVGELTEFLGCKRTTAGARLSTMNGDSKRIFAPPRSDFGEDALDAIILRERIAERMYKDSSGFWKIFNKAT